MENLGSEANFGGDAESIKDDAKLQRELGSTVLSATGFHERQKEIVEPSFNKALKNGEKLPGKNAERRNYAYLSRLENLIDKYGNPAEKKLWEASMSEDLLVKYEDIPEAYWQSKKQELRDSGYGDIELNDYYKRELLEKERELQKDSLEKWANYLGDEHSPYPLWFKVYAWDGMTKMGKYDKSKGRYATRNKTTVAPYPNPDAEVLGGVFEVVNRYYGNNEREFYTEEGERNVGLERIVQTGNFAKIYNAVEHDIAPIIEPPEKTEDVHGSWLEYGIGEEDDIARAAKGTGWCVASPSVGKQYLEYGTYGQDNDWGEDDDDYYDYDDDKNDEAKSNKSKFILFHLENPDTGKLSKNAVASIRLDPNGQVAEISGLRGGQALNDSLVPIVEEKVKSLPNGEKFLEAFADKQELIRLDHKMQNDEDLTKEELEFIYEIHRPIKTLDTYNDYDPRVEELKKKYGVEYALDAGVDVDAMADKLTSKWMNRGYADGENLEDLDILLSHGADANRIVSNLTSDDIAENLDTLLSHGADVNQIVFFLLPYDIAYNLGTLLARGASIDVNELTTELDSDDIVHNLDTLLYHGADINQIVSNLDSGDIAENLDALLFHGADVNQIVSNLDSDDIAYSLDTLIPHGADINQIVSNLDSGDIAENLDILLARGASIDVNELVSDLGSWDIAHNLDTLISHGADINQIVSNLDSDDIVHNLDTLISRGADINQIVSGLAPSHIVENLDTLLSHGASIDIDKLVSELGPFGVAYNLDTLLSHGADVNLVVSRLGPGDIVGQLDTLLSHGASIDIDKLVSELEPFSIAYNLDTLLSHGASIDVNELTTELDSDDIAHNLDTLLSHGADMNLIVSKLDSDDITRYLDRLRTYGYQG